ncbi:MAG: DUF6249 domain-containing protein, partial [Flavobacteriales bacterium]|nr:DUF6249 domain-containing protein [Flavobacteriales bacterium]
MRQKSIIIILVLLVPLTMVFGQRKSQTASAENDTTVVVTRVDTVYKNATQYALDSLKYDAEQSLERIKNERYKDSIVYSYMSADRLYILQMKKVDRYYRTTEEELLNGPLIPVSMFVIGILVLIWLLLLARERGKRREHEYRMAQLEKGLQEKIIVREIEKVEVPVEKRIYVHQDKDKNTVEESSIEPQKPVYQNRRAENSFWDYLRVGTKYRKRGVLLIAFGVVVMLFFLSMGTNSPWGLGFILVFIGVAYLY